MIANMAGEPRIGSGLGSDYLALLQRRAAEGKAHPPKRGWKEGMMSRRTVAQGGRTLEGYELYVPARVLPEVRLSKFGVLTMPPVVVEQIGPYVQVLWSGDRKALALRRCVEADDGAMLLRSADGGKPSVLLLRDVFKHFGVRITTKSRYGAAVANGVMVLALQGIEVGGQAGED